MRAAGGTQAGLRALLSTCEAYAGSLSLSQKMSWWPEGWNRSLEELLGSRGNPSSSLAILTSIVLRDRENLFSFID